MGSRHENNAKKKTTLHSVFGEIAILESEITLLPLTP
jgi:hypothetical protein